ncbi:hypothetical protein N7519_006657 [Penicillium mononematosum]|uniref:uncharacterized protein n=1 Tax=Penicillium mononematosum TaxID=268346 RepID=UPI0025483A05|nr:uncharacterized protein N7519_006657 [Penicillium mononematosum]KAJ6185356.1 hypothetical protein N7519_006657 [Penicillium mononematosum]
MELVTISHYQERVVATCQVCHANTHNHVAHHVHTLSTTMNSIQDCNMQLSRLQLAAIQHQNPPTSLFLLLCDDEWKILPTEPVADAGSSW